MQVPGRFTPQAGANDAAKDSAKAPPRADAAATTAATTAAAAVMPAQRRTGSCGASAVHLGLAVDDADPSALLPSVATLSTPAPSLRAPTAHSPPYRRPPGIEAAARV